MTELTELERAVLARLLEGRHRLLEQLREQLPNCRVTRRELTGVGFYAYLDCADAPRANHANLRFGDVVAQIGGMADGAGFVLYVEHGRLYMLEGYGYSDPWPNRIGGYALQYNGGDRRDWGALTKALE